jgi:hypothetical protein
VDQRHLYLLFFISLGSLGPPTEFSLGSPKFLCLILDPTKTFGFRAFTGDDQTVETKVQSNYVGGVDLAWREIGLFSQNRNKVFTGGLLRDGNAFNFAQDPTVEHYVQQPNFGKLELAVLDPNVLINTTGSVASFGFVLRLKLREPSLTVLLRVFLILKKLAKCGLHIHLDITQRHTINVSKEWIIWFVKRWCRISKLLGLFVRFFKCVQHEVPNPLWRVVQACSYFTTLSYF